MLSTPPSAFPPGPTADAYLLEGIDVSVWQGRIDWQRVAAAGKRFAWIRASVGTKPDERFVENWAGALAAGVQRGAYHYLDRHSSGAEQAGAFLATYPGAGELPTVLDLEEAGRGESPAALVARALDWLRAVEAATGSKPWVYTMPSFALSRLRCPEAVELGGYGLWVAHWDVAVPSVPEPWRDWSCWQTRSRGTVDGITGRVDLNVLRPEALGLAEGAGSG